MEPTTQLNMKRNALPVGQSDRPLIPKPFAAPGRTIGARFSRASSASVSLSDDPTKKKMNAAELFGKPIPATTASLALPTPPPAARSGYLPAANSAAHSTLQRHNAITSSIGVDTLYKSDTGIRQSDSSRTVFDFMSFDDALQYLRVRQGVVEYVHCVARHHLDKKARTNTYDLVMLEKPCYPESGQVFSKDDRSDRRKQGKFPGQLMQLSLKGVIMDNDDRSESSQMKSREVGNGLFVPLDDFIYERDLCYQLLDKSFFKHFKQQKVFTAWKLSTRQTVFKQRLKQFSTTTIFADRPLVSLVSEIYCKVYNLKQSVDLFEYFGSGLLNTRSYLRAQEKKLYVEFSKITCAVLKIGELIEERYTNVVSKDYMGTKINEIIAHHPYSRAPSNAQEGEEVDWEHVRSVQRLKADYKHKIEMIFKCADFMIETMLGTILLRFWSRLTRSVAGVTIANRDQGRAIIGYWAQLDEIDFEKQSMVASARVNVDNGAFAETYAAELSNSSSRRCAIDDAVSRKGRHLTINTAFFVENYAFEPDTHVSSKDISKLKIAVDPSSAQVMHYLHELYGVIGILLGDLPKLKFHPVIYKEEKRVDIFQDNEENPVATSRAPTPAGALKKRSPWRRGEHVVMPTAETLVEMVSTVRNQAKGGASSSVLYVYIQNCTILAQMGTQQISVRALHHFRLAVAEASQVEDVMNTLNEMFHNMWALNPLGLLKQLERSSLLPLLKDGINGIQNVSVDHINQSLSRERTRLNTLLSSMAYLDSVETMLLEYSDLKHSLGIVCTFKVAVQQLRRIREKQIMRLANALPITFISRCRMFTDFLFTVQKRLDPSLLGGFDKEIKMLKAVEYFDAAKALFDEECEICEKIYRIMWEQKQKEEGADGSAAARKHLTSAASMSSSSATDTLPQTRIKNASSNPHSLFELYTEAKHTCHDSIVGCRLELGRVLPHIKKEILQKVHHLHGDIEGYMKNLDELVEIAINKNRKLRAEDFLIVETNGEDGILRSPAAEKDILDGNTVASICELLEDLETQLKGLHREVKEIISVQELLVMSHAIVGSALPVLAAEDVERFKDMEMLESQFQIKNKAWISVGEAITIHANISSTRLGNSNISAVYDRVNAFSEIIEFLKQQVDSNNPALVRLKKSVHEIKPQLEILAYLTCDALRRSHWEHLAEVAFAPLDYNLSVTGHGIHSVTVSELQTTANGGCTWKNLGSLRSLPLSDLMSKGMSHQLQKLKDVTASALMQSMIEKTLTAATFCMNNASAVLSKDWLSNPKMKDKIPFDLSRLSNCEELSVLFQYCFKAVLVAEHTAVDMNIGLFDNRISETKSTLSNIIDFLKDLDTIQRRWIGLFKFMKFSAQGEIDRDTLRLYQVCTEEMKKVEIFLKEGYGHCSFLDSFIRLTESETSPKTILSNLNIVLEDMHTSVQSVLDACPRLSLLPYHRLRELIKLWISCPLGHMNFVSECFNEMFEGVGSLRIEELKVQGIHVCKGFLSSDKSETIMFETSISLASPIDEFINGFEKRIREAITKGCDLINSHRAELTKILLNDVLPERTVLVTKEIFNTRISMIKPQESVGAVVNCNQSTILMNLSVFAEDIWLCLGFAVGTIIFAKPGIEAVVDSAFVPAWRASMNVMFTVSTEMIGYCRVELSDNRTSQQRRALLASLMQLEVGHLQTIKDLMQCNCRDSALEMWSGRYQLRYLYDEKERVRNCPFEVALGCVSLPYGMEYYGGLFPLHLGPGIEYAVSKAIGSAFSYKGTIFLSYETDESPLEVKGEYSVSCKDVSIALGRVYSVLASVHNANSVKLFLARLIYLDAVGCVDFTTMGEPGIQMLVDALSQMWTAIERKDDFFMVGSLKYPLKTNAVRGLSQAANKRKSTTSNFMHSMNTKGGVYSGIYLIGMASETLYSEASVFNQFANSVFNTVAVDHSRPTEDLGVMLTVAGFSCGVLLQELFEHVVIHVKERFVGNFPQLHALTSTGYIRSILRRSSEFYAAEKYFHIAANKGQSLTGFLLLRFEVQVFINALWDVVLTCIGGDVGNSGVSSLREAIISILQTQLDLLLSDDEKVLLNTDIATAKQTISAMAEQEIHRAARTLKYVADPLFLANCYAVWRQICSKSSCLGILHGHCASGKTAVRKTVLTAMRAFKGLEFTAPSVVSSNSSALAGWKAALMLTRVVKRWKLRKQMFIGDDMFWDPLEPRPTSRSGSSSGDRVKNRASDKAPAEPIPVVPLVDEGSTEDGHSIKSIIIHHSSLSCDHLVGTFDSHGRWSDGLLLRTIRNYDVSSLESSVRSVYSRFCVIILDGPLGSQVEQLFSGSRYNTGRGIPANNEKYNNLMVFPSGECCKLSGEVSILIETSDLSQASPPMLLYTAKVDINADSNYCSKRLVETWVHQFIPELLKYGPWEEAAREVEELLRAFKLIYDLLYFDSSEKNTFNSTAVSKTNGFLHYMEELLLQCHELFLAECVILKPEDKSAVKRGVSRQNSGFARNLRQSSLSFMIDDEETRELQSEHILDSSGVTYILDPSGQELMLQRVRCAVMYAAIWSFGGPVNGSERRKFFETVAKLSFTEAFGPYAEFPDRSSLFELVLDLKEGVFKEALESRRMTHTVHPSLEQFVIYTAAGMSDPATARLRSRRKSHVVDPREQHHMLAPVDVEEVVLKDGVAIAVRSDLQSGPESTLDDSSADPFNIRFYTPGTWALISSLEVLFRSGCRVLLSGMACSGKTEIVKALLQKYGTRCPHPRNMKSDMMRSLLDIIAGDKMPEGTPAVLDILTSFLNKIGSNAGLGNFQSANGTAEVADSASVWHAIRRILQENDSYQASTREHCATKTVFSSAVSLRVVPTANALRDWLARELGTENGTVLEAPRFTRAVVFIDDLHMAVNHNITDESTKSTSDRIVENRLEGLLRGILQSHGSFIEPAAFRSKESAQQEKTKENSIKDKLLKFLTEPNHESKLPILHKSILSDPRADSKEAENYYMDDIGVFAAATGDMKGMEQQAELKQLLQYFCVISTPMTTINEIHSALVQGSTRVLSGCPLELTPGGLTMINLCLRDLSSATVAIMKMLTNTSKSQESGLSVLEGSQRKLLFMSMPVIRRLCATLSISRQLITSQVSLLQLWVHEWKRNYLDVFPHGVQRNRVVEMLQEQLDKIDIKKWRISPTTYQSLVSDVEVATGSVWVDVDRLLRRTSTVPAIVVEKRPESLQVIEEEESEDESVESSGASKYFYRYTPVAMFSPEDRNLTEAGDYDSSAEDGRQSRARGDHEAINCVPLRLNLPSSLSLLSVMYPAAVAMMLRIVRILTSISSHVVLSGFVGSSRLPVLHLAANIIDYGIEVYEVSNCLKATEFNSYSSYSSISLDFSSFLKHCVLRVCGIKLMDNVGSFFGPAVFTSAPSASVLAAVTSAQLLSSAERQTLLNVIEGDYAALFQNREIEDKESAIVDAGDSVVSASDDNDSVESTESEIRSNGLKDTERKASLSSRKNSTALRMESMIEDMKEQSSATKKSAWGRSTGSSKKVIGYTYNWVKSVLREKVFHKLKIILSLDFPRVAPISVSNTSSHDSADVDINGTGSFVQSDFVPEQKVQRFSLLSGKSRVGSHLSTGSTPSTPQRARPVSRGRSSRAREGGGVRSSTVAADEAPGAVATEQKFLLTGCSDNFLSASSAPGHLFYDCPVLGGVLTHKFCHLWWDISSFQSIQGVCFNVLRNFKSPHFHSPHSITLASRNILLTDSDSSTTATTVERTMRRTAPSADGITKWNLRIHHRGNNSTSEFYRKVSNIQYLGVFLTFAKKDGLYMTKPLVLNPGVDAITNDDVTSGGGADFYAANKRKKSSAYNLNDLQNQVSTEEAELEESTGKLLEAMVDEARHLLPHLLAMECPADSVILNQPVITMEPDRYAELACRMAIQLIEDGGRMLLRRRDDCIATDALHKHSLLVLASSEPIMENVRSSVEEMHGAMRLMSSALIDVKDDIETCREKYSKTSHNERYLSSIEDIVSTEENIKYLTLRIDNLTAASRASLLSINIRDWNLFGKLVEEPKSFVAYGMTVEIVHMLRGVILLADPHIRSKSSNEIAELSQLNSDSATGNEKNVLPNKAKLNEIRKSVSLKSSEARNPTRFTSLVKEQQSLRSNRPPVVIHLADEDVFGHASGLLSSPDVISRLLSRNSANISPSHILELKTINAIIRKVDHEFDRSDLYDDTETIGSGTTQSDSDLASHLILKLKDFMFSLETCCDYSAYVAHLKAELGMKRYICKEVHGEVQDNIATKLKELDNKKNAIERDLQDLDIEITNNRIKIARLTNLKSCKERIMKSVEEHRQYVINERRQLDNILKNLVADSCIAVTCLVRTGWLPEQIRQECLERFRTNLQWHKAGMHLTESPFILGCMLDRLQVKRWTLTQQSTDTLPRDPGSINSMSLVMMNPAFTFVVDPEGAASGPIKNAYRENYGIFESTAANFSLEKLERVLVEARGTRSLACIITECQAGVSQDLITFLSADYDWFDQQRASFDPRKGHERRVVDETAGTRSDTAALQGLKGIFNGDRTDDKRHESIHKLFSLTGNLRVVLLSALGPIIDTTGHCTPLPPCCFKNMITVHWTSCHHSSYFMDPKPFHSALGKTFAADYLLENCMVESICREIAPTHSVQMRLLSERVIEWSMRIINQEGDVTSALMKWMVGHPDDAMIPRVYTSKSINLKISYITIGYLINEQCCNALLLALSKRVYLSKGVQSAKRLERDMICYQNAVGEACAMAADFLRVTSVILPVNLLPPYALTAKAIAAKCVTGMITQNVELLSMIPSALKDVHRILNGIVNFQKHFLKTRGQVRNKPKLPPSVKSRMTAGLSKAGGAVRSTFLGQRGSTLAAIIATPDDEIDNAVIAAQSMQVTLNRNGQPQVINPCLSTETVDPKSVSGSAQAKDGPMYLDDMMGMKRKDRANAVSAVHFFLEPVRDVLLKAAVAYVYNEVKPGFEWMVKFSILLTTWAQSSTPLPTDELRALFHFYSRIFSGDTQRVRYAFISATAAVPQEVEDTVEVGLPVTTVLLRNENEDDLPSRPNSAGNSQQKIVDTRVSMIEQLIGSAVHDEAGENDEDDSGTPGAIPLPNVLALKDRRTGFFTSESKPLSNGIRMLQNNLASFAVGHSYIQKLSEGAASETQFAMTRAKAKDIEDKSFRGPGGIDGLNVHRRSTRWRIKSAETSVAMQTARDGLECGQPIIRWDPVLCDVPGSEVTVKNEIFRAKIVVGNMFELDWLQASKGSQTAAISIPGVDVRSSILQGSLKTSGMSLRALEARASALEGSGDRRKSSVLRMTRINSHNKASLRGTHNFGNQSNKPRRHSNKSRNSLVKVTSRPSGHGQQGSSSRSDPSLTPAARASNLRVSLARRSVRKQSVSYMDSPEPTQTKRLSKVNSIRKSGLVKKLSVLKKISKDEADDVESNSNFGVMTPKKQDLKFPGQEKQTPTAAAMSPEVQAALAAAQKFKKQQAGGSPTKGGQSSPSRPDYYKGILSLFESMDNYQEFKILERHPSLAPIFRGMSEGIGMYPEQFLEWKKFILSLSNINFSTVSRSDLVHLAANIIPPQLEMEASDLMTPKGSSNLGVWAIGKELTVIQTLLLTTVVSPSSCRAVAELMFSLTDHYLQRGGIVLRHQDELSSDEDSDSDDEFSDNDPNDEDYFKTIKEEDEEDEDEEEALDAFHGDAGLDDEWVPPPSHGRLSDDYGDVIRPSAAFMDDYNEEEDDARSVSSRDSRSSERYRRGSRLQLGVSALNCWTHLKHASAGVIRPPGLRYAKKHSQYRNTCRTFENWEGVLKDILSTTFLDGDFRIVATSPTDHEGNAVTFGGQMENEDHEEESNQKNNTLQKPFSALLKRSKYRILFEYRSPTLVFKPFMPIFLGSHSSLNYMSYLSLVCRELGTFKSFHFSASPRATVINCALLEKHYSRFYQLGSFSSGTAKASAASKSVNDRKGRPTSVPSDDIVVDKVSNPDRLKALIKIVEKGISSTAYLKIPKAKPNGGTINILEMLDMHSPVCSSIVWAAAVHHRSVRAKLEDDLHSDLSSFLNISNSLMSSLAGQSSIEASKSLTLESLLGKNTTKEPLSSSKKNDVIAVGKLAPVPLTAFWETNESGFGPLMSLSEFQFHWLPSINVADLISAGGINQDKVTQETPTQAVEGMVWEQLHASYLYTFNTVKRLAKITTDVKMKERIKNLSDMEIRVAGGVVTLWRFILYLRSRNLEMEGRPGAWSQCLVPLSMWQIARIAFKVSDMMKENWVFHIGTGRRAASGAGSMLQTVDVNVSALLSCNRFRRLTALCTESLCYISYEDTSVPTNNHEPSQTSVAEVYADDIVRRRRSTNIRSSIINVAFSKAGAVEPQPEPKSRGLNRGTIRRTLIQKQNSNEGNLIDPVPPQSTRPSNSLQFNLTTGVLSESFRRGDDVADDRVVTHPTFDEITDPSLFLKYSYKSSFGGVELRDRLLSTIGRFIAEVITLRTQALSGSPSTVKTYKNNAPAVLDNQRSTAPAAVNLYATQGMSFGSQGKNTDDPKNGWPELSSSKFDLNMGTMNSEHLISYVSKWSLSEE